MNKTFSLLSLTFALLMGFVSCNSTVREPVDERKSKDHGDPISVLLTLTPGTLVNQVFTPQLNPTMPQRSRQTIEYSLQKEIGWAPKAGSNAGFEVYQASEDPTQVYRLDIRYYDLEHKDITYQFVENGQDKIHQHFFTAENVKTTDGTLEHKEVRSNAVFDYVYGDTDPWSQEMGNNGVRWIGKDNPIGFKGYFRFKQARNFEINTRLMHARISKYSRRDHTVSPFYAPTPGQRSEDAWDVTMRFPVSVSAASTTQK